ncbi:hypothetical protein RB195_007103 [Necator americanus]|uniref:Endonuclease/exonuclease/phosphatase domain-containing protein n=1 Tax=Necator americanus TaxID=51031 RepID=A0ABR1BVL8_NECAM
MEEVIRNEKSYKFIFGDFNAKLGKAAEEEYRIGRIGLEDRNENSNRLDGVVDALWKSSLHEERSSSEEMEIAQWRDSCEDPLYTH